MEHPGKQQVVVRLVGSLFPMSKTRVELPASGRKIQCELRVLVWFMLWGRRKGRRREERKASPSLATHILETLEKIFWQEETESHLSL